MWWLLIPYCLILFVNALQLYLIKSNTYPTANESVACKLIKYQESPRSWFFWLGREGKDWLAAGLIGSFGVSCLMSLLPFALFWLAGTMFVILLVQSGFALALALVALDYAVPGWLQGIALRASLPEVTVGGRWRALCWGGLFMVVGAAGLWSWFGLGGTEPVFLAFLSLVLGFLSLLKALLPGSDSEFSA